MWGAALGDFKKVKFNYARIAQQQCSTCLFSVAADPLDVSCKEYGAVFPFICLTASPHSHIILNLKKNYLESDGKE